MSDKLRIAYTEKIDKLTEEQKLCIEYLYQICLEQPYIRYNIFTGDPEIFKEEKDDYFEYSLHHLQIEDQVMDIIIYHEIEHHIKDSRLSMSLNDNFSTKIEFNNLIGIMYYTILKQAMFKPKKKKCANPDCDNLIDLRKVNYNTKYCSERCKNLINQRKYQARKKNK